MFKVRKSRNGFNIGEVLIITLCIAGTLFIAKHLLLDSGNNSSRQQSTTGSLWHTITLYAADGKVIRKWHTKDLNYLTGGGYFYDEGGNQITFSGTYVDEPYKLSEDNNQTR